MCIFFQCCSLHSYVAKFNLLIYSETIWVLEIGTQFSYSLIATIFMNYYFLDWFYVRFSNITKAINSDQQELITNPALTKCLHSLVIRSMETGCITTNHFILDNWKCH